MTSAEIQQLISRNAAAQDRLLAGEAPDKVAQLRVLQEEQSRLYTARAAARRAEQGRLPAEKVGVGF